MPLRPVTIERHVMEHAEGSALITAGRTRVLTTASVLEEVPHWMRGSGKGWITAEYGMLPRSTHTRKSRERARDGRTIEIQRLIGRSLRAAVDMKALGERMITVDCDVLSADGGTRTAGVTGGMVALADALIWMAGRGLLKAAALRHFVAAVSVGVVRGEVVCDLDYENDSAAEVDMNVVMTESGEFIEVQGTGEHGTFGRQRLDELLDAATAAIRELIGMQKAALGRDLEKLGSP